MGVESDVVSAFAVASLFAPLSMRTDGWRGSARTCASLVYKN